MAFLLPLRGSSNVGVLSRDGPVSLADASALPSLRRNLRAPAGWSSVRSFYVERHSFSSRSGLDRMMPKRTIFTIPRSGGSPNSSNTSEGSSDQGKAPFGYTRKDVLLIGVGVTVLGIGLKSGLEFAGVDPLQAGNVVQLVLVLGLTVGWISTYIFRVSNKEMTYAQQLRDYENKVMEKRIESLTEAELEALLEQVEEEKTRLASGEQVN
ncbi:uncharacterized protein LOC115734782 isoform X1 [Rhodamnia argentea]|uniref:Uncharacterized protein LOC115734782 isoform X1 n=1 Tax=Rhodamnia argentea TaxID=178133 RepID=A0A8B8NGG7_9MYRT|nr:uncharacterized protein LOC115734782 isoform X1 [Rhodamnia argentea]